MAFIPLNFSSHFSITSLVNSSFNCPIITNEAKIIKAELRAVLADTVIPSSTRLLPPMRKAAIINTADATYTIIRDCFIFPASRHTYSCVHASLSVTVTLITLNKSFEFIDFGTHITPLQFLAPQFAIYFYIIIQDSCNLLKYM